MRGLLLAALILVLPWFGYAQQEQGPIDPVSTTAEFLGMSSNQALAVGLGIVGGATGLHLLLGGGAATLAGAFGGALIGHWWYEQKLRAMTSEAQPYTVYYAPTRQAAFASAEN